MLTFTADRFNVPPSGELADDAEMFELAPVSLWLEDYSGVKALFDDGGAQASPTCARSCARTRGAPRPARTASASSR